MNLNNLNQQQVNSFNSTANETEISNQSKIVHEILNLLKATFTVINNQERKQAEERLDNMSQDILLNLEQIILVLTQESTNSSVVLSAFNYFRTLIKQAIRNHEISTTRATDLLNLYTSLILNQEKHFINLIKPVDNYDSQLCCISDSIFTNLLQTAKFFLDYTIINLDPKVYSEFTNLLIANYEIAIKTLNLRLLKSCLNLTDIFFACNLVNIKTWREVFKKLIKKLKSCQEIIIKLVLFYFPFSIVESTVQTEANSDMKIEKALLAYEVVLPFTFSKGGVNNTNQKFYYQRLFFFALECFNILNNTLKVMVLKLRSRIQKINLALADFLEFYTSNTDFLTYSLEGIIVDYNKIWTDYMHIKSLQIQNMEGGIGGMMNMPTTAPEELKELFKKVLLFLTESKKTTPFPEPEDEYSLVEDYLTLNKNNSKKTKNYFYNNTDLKKMLLSNFISSSGIEKIDILVNKSKMYCFTFINCLLLNFSSDAIQNIISKVEKNDLEKLNPNSNSMSNSNLTRNYTANQRRGDNNREISLSINNNMNSYENLLGVSELTNQKTSMLDYDSLIIQTQNNQFSISTDEIEKNPFYIFVYNTQLHNSNKKLVAKIFDDLKKLVKTSFPYLMNLSEKDRHNQFDYTYSNLLYEAILFSTKLLFLPNFIEFYSPSIKNIILEVIFPLVVNRVNEIELFMTKGEDYFHQVSDAMENGTYKSIKTICSIFIKKACMFYDGLSSFIFQLSLEAIIISMFLMKNVSTFTSSNLEQSQIETEVKNLDTYLTMLLRKTDRIITISSEVFRIMNHISIIENSFYLLCIISNRILSDSEKEVGLLSYNLFNKKDEKSNTKVNILVKFIEENLHFLLEINNPFIMDRISLFISIYSGYLFSFDSNKMSMLIEVVLICLVSFQQYPGLVQISAHSIKEIFSSPKIETQIQVIDKYFEKLITELKITNSCLFLEAFYDIIFKINSPKHTLKIIETCVERIEKNTKEKLNERFKIFKIVNGKSNPQEPQEEYKRTNSDYVQNKILNILRLLLSKNNEDLIAYNLNELESILIRLVSFIKFIKKIDFDDDIIDIAYQIIRVSRKFTLLQEMVFTHSTEYTNKYNGLCGDLFLYINQVLLNCSDVVAKNEAYSNVLYKVFLDSVTSEAAIEFSHFSGINLMIIFFCQTKQINEVFLLNLLTIVAANIFTCLPLEENFSFQKEFYYYKRQILVKPMSQFNPETFIVDEPYFLLSLTALFFSAFIHYPETAMKFLVYNYLRFSTSEIESNLVINNGENNGQGLKLSLSNLRCCVELILLRKSLYSSYLFKLIITGFCKLISYHDFISSLNSQDNMNQSVFKLISCSVLMLQIQKRNENNKLKESLRQKYKGVAGGSLARFRENEESNRKNNSGNSVDSEGSHGGVSFLNKKQLNSHLKLEVLNKILEQDNSEDEYLSEEEKSEETDSEEEENYDEFLIQNKHSLKQSIQKELNNKLLKNPSKDQSIGKIQVSTDSSKFNIEEYSNLGKNIDINQDLNEETDREGLETIIKTVNCDYKNFDEYSYFKKSLNDFKENNPELFQIFLSQISESEKTVLNSIVQTTRIKILRKDGLDNTSGNTNTPGNINMQGLNVNNMQTSNFSFGNNNIQVGMTGMNINEEEEIQTVPRKIIKIKKKGSVRFNIGESLENNQSNQTTTTENTQISGNNNADLNLG